VLSGQRVAVKDMFAVAGHRTGAGVPGWLDLAIAPHESADAVAALHRAGAQIVGIAHTDELAFGLNGVNAHYGTPPNPAAPGAVPGGSSSGSASAVALGMADIGLGTDTAGSIRVPSSYCGLVGLRTTTGAIGTRGVLGLAPSFDAVGLLGRTVGAVSSALGVLAAGATDGPQPGRLVIDMSLFALAEPGVSASLLGALRAAMPRLGLEVEVACHALAPDVTGPWFTAFRAVQAAEAWSLRGSFIEANPGAVSAEVAARFRSGADVDAQTLRTARAELARARDVLSDRLTDALLVLPTTATSAPSADDAGAVEAARARTLPLTALASWAGRPAVSLPVGMHRGRPVGISLVGSPGSDTALMRTATRFLPDF
jgi:Asp-tRNA(Asn)/Glu-tRNA(Gln) amidotransferase A subunit family amidase